MHINFWHLIAFQVAALILENTFTSILDMAGVLLPFLKWFIGGSDAKGPKLLNFLVRSPWSTIDIIGKVRYILFDKCIMSISSLLTSSPYLIVLRFNSECKHV